MSALSNARRESAKPLPKSGIGALSCRKSRFWVARGGGGGAEGRASCGDRGVASEVHINQRFPRESLISRMPQWLRGFFARRCADTAPTPARTTLFGDFCQKSSSLLHLRGKSGAPARPRDPARAYDLGILHGASSARSPRRDFRRRNVVSEGAAKFLEKFFFGDFSLGVF